MPFGAPKQQPRADGSSLVNMEGMDPEVRQLLLDMDLDANGRLTVGELRDAVALFRDVRSNQTGINYTQLPKDVQDVLATFDEDKSGTVDTSELALGAKLYQESKQQSKRLRKIIAGMSLLILMLMAAMTGLVFAVVELSKETKANPDGTMTVAGSDVAVKVENPGFTTSTNTTSGSKDGARRRMLLSADGGQTATALVDASGAAIVTGALTDDTGTQVDSFGNDVSTATKSYEDSFGGEALVDLLHIEDRSYLESISSIETMDTDGGVITLGITGYDFEDIHFTRDSAGELVRATDSAGMTYDMAVHILLLHTSHARFPEILVANVEPLSEAEAAKTEAVNFSIPLPVGSEVDDLLDAFYGGGAGAEEDADEGDGGDGRKLLWWRRPSCNVWCQLGKIKNQAKAAQNAARRQAASASRAWRQVSSWKSKASRAMRSARNAANNARNQLNRFTSIVRTSMQRVQRAGSDLTDLPATLMQKVRSKVDPISQLSGCDIITLMANEINKYLAQNPMCLSPGCSGSHLNSGSIESLHDSDTWKIGAKTDLTACFQLYDLKLDCAGLDQAMNEFWAENELAQSINEAITNNQQIKNLKANIDVIRNQLSRWSGRRLVSEDHRVRSLLAEMEESAYAALDEDALVDELHEATKKHVGERLTEFMKRRKVLENPGEIIKIKSLRARTTVNMATHIVAEAAAEASYDRDFAEELGDLGFSRVQAIPGTLGLVTTEVEASMEVRAPIVISVSGSSTATVDLKVNGVTIDQDFYDASTTKTSTGSTDGSQVYIAGTAEVNAALQAEIKSHASFKICFAGACAGLGLDAMIDAATGADSALTTTHTDGSAWSMNTKHTKYAKYTDVQKKPYEDAKVAAAGGLAVAGGAWMYMTMPYLRIFPILGMDDTPLGSCKVHMDNLFEFKPAASLKDDLAASEVYEHPYGKYIIRTAVGFGSSLGLGALTPSTPGGTFPINIPTFTSPASWDGVLDDVAASGRRRALLAAPVGASTGVSCTEFNGGNATHFKGTVPVARATCFDDRALHVDGENPKQLCWSRDCCHGHAVKMAFGRVVCVPGDVAKGIADQI